jgi:hypothetical protein
LLFIVQQEVSALSSAISAAKSGTQCPSRGRSFSNNWIKHSSQSLLDLIIHLLIPVTTSPGEK